MKLGSISYPLGVSCGAPSSPVGDDIDGKWIVVQAQVTINDVVREPRRARTIAVVNLLLDVFRSPLFDVGGKCLGTLTTVY